MHLYIAGDIGGYKSAPSLDAGLCWQRLHMVGEDRLILLGDNIYPKGIPAKTDADYPEMASRLRLILDYGLAHFASPLFMLPGNHDYNRGKPDGVEHWQNQVELVQSFYPDRIRVTEGGEPMLLRLGKINCILIDTQHYLQPNLSDADLELIGLYRQLRRLLDNCIGGVTIICGHHPLYSRAMHGGKFSMRQHLFPLSLLRKRLLVPLPIVGSAMALGRRALGAKEDMRHPRYRRLRKVLKKAIYKYKNLIYAAGHDHNLQHYGIAGNHFIVSGSASKTAYVRPGGRSDFVARMLGCFRLTEDRMEAIDFAGQVQAHWPMLPLERADKPPRPQAGN